MRSNGPFLLTEISEPSGLNWLDPRDFMDRDLLTKAEFDHVFRLCQAAWVHSGNPKDPHVELTSGKCSNGFFAVPRVLKFPNLCEIMAIQMARVFEKAVKDKGLPAWEKGYRNWVVGSDHASAIFSQRVAAHLQAKYDFTEKGPDKKLPDGKVEKTQIWTRETIESNEFVLQAEELVTTTATMAAVRQGIVAGTAHYSPLFYPALLTLIHRSPQPTFDGSPILYVQHYDIETWDSPEVCPLCQQGSRRIKSPKQHWAELTCR